MIDNEQWIQDYLTGKLSYSDQQIFETKLKEDKEFRTEVVLEKFLMEQNKQVQLTEINEQIEKAESSIHKVKNTINEWKNTILEQFDIDAGLERLCRKKLAFRSGDKQHIEVISPKNQAEIEEEIIVQLSAPAPKDIRAIISNYNGMQETKYYILQESQIQLTIPVPNLPAGRYYLKIIHESQTIVRSFFIEKEIWDDLRTS